MCPSVSFFLFCWMGAFFCLASCIGSLDLHFAYFRFSRWWIFSVESRDIVVEYFSINGLL